LRTVNTPSRVKRASYVNRIFLLFAKLHHLETDVHSGSSGKDGIYRHESRRGLSVPIPVRYHVSVSTAAITPPSPTGVRTVRGRPAFTRAIGVTLPVSRRRCSNRLNDVERDSVARIPVLQ
jgi:hypothetical protein